MSKQQTFKSFVDEALTAKKSFRWASDDPNDERRLMDDTAGSYKLSTRAWYQSTPMITDTNQNTGWKVPINRWLEKAGVRVVRSQDFLRYENIGVAVVNDIPTVWLPEDASVTTVDPVTAVAKAYPAVVATGIELSRPSKATFFGDLDEWLQMNFQVAFEKAIQSGVLNGNGTATGELAGILSSDIEVVADTSGVPLQIATALTHVADNGGSNAFVVVSPAVRGSLMTTYINSGDKAVWQVHADGTETCMGIPAGTDVGLPALTGVLGDFSAANLFMNSEMDVRYSTTNSAGLVNMFGFLDAALLFNPNRFAKLTFTA